MENLTTAAPYHVLDGVGILKMSQSSNFTEFRCLALSVAHYVGPLVSMIYETLPIVLTSDAGSPSAVVKDGQLSEYPTRTHHCQDLVVLDNLQLPLWERAVGHVSQPDTVCHRNAMLLW